MLEDFVESVVRTRLEVYHILRLLLYLSFVFIAEVVIKDVFVIRRRIVLWFGHSSPGKQRLMLLLRMVLVVESHAHQLHYMLVHLFKSSFQLDCNEPWRFCIHNHLFNVLHLWVRFEKRVYFTWHDHVVWFDELWKLELMGQCSFLMNCVPVDAGWIKLINHDHLGGRNVLLDIN